MSDHEDRRGELLLTLTRSALEQRLLGREPEKPSTEAWLDEPGAVFVTLLLDGLLRGCIGTLEAWRPLREDLAANAVAAALRDPRFPPLASEELPVLRIEVSLLEPAEPLAAETENDALKAIRPGIDGLILEHPGGQGTFLPQVWEQLPEPRDFLRHLKRKAGLPDEGWSDSFRLSRYGVTKWSEQEHER